MVGGLWVLERRLGDVAMGRGNTSRPAGSELMVMLEQSLDDSFLELEEDEVNIIEYHCSVIQRT